MTAKFFFRRSSPTAGPDTSVRAPLAQESLTVTTAADRGSGVEASEPSGIEEDIFFFLFWFCAAVALRLIELAQTFHQQTLRVQLGRLLSGLAFEIDFKVSIRPAQDFEHRRIPDQRAIAGVCDLAFFEVQFAFVAFVGERERAAFAAHL